MTNGNGDRFVLGVTGHRDLDGAEEQVIKALNRALAEYQRLHEDGLAALSAIAAGADTLFAEAAISLGIRLEAVLPFEGYEADFPPGDERRRFETLLGTAQAISTLPYAGRSDDAYAAVGKWIVDRSDHLLAVWDGKPARGRGGTGDVVEYARKMGRPVTVITPTLQRQERRRHSMKGGTTPASTPISSVDKFEEYRTFIQSTEKLTDRRQLGTQIWVTLHTLLFAALGFLMKEAAASTLLSREAGVSPATPVNVEWIFALATTGPLLVLGLFSCLIWRKMLMDYRALIGWRFEQLMEMERSAELEGLHRVFNREFEAFFGPEAKRARISFTQMEALLPTVLIFVYLAFGFVGLLLGLGTFAL
jgi:hypothetical protein